MPRDSRLSTGSEMNPETISNLSVTMEDTEGKLNGKAEPKVKPIDERHPPKQKVESVSPEEPQQKHIKLAEASEGGNKPSKASPEASAQQPTIEPNEVKSDEVNSTTRTAESVSPDKAVNEVESPPAPRTEKSEKDADQIAGTSDDPKVTRRETKPPRMVNSETGEEIKDEILEVSTNANQELEVIIITKDELDEHEKSKSQVQTEENDRLQEAEAVAEEAVNVILDEALKTHFLQNQETLNLATDEVVIVTSTSKPEDNQEKDVTVMSVTYPVPDENDRRANMDHVSIVRVGDNHDEVKDSSFKELTETEPVASKNLAQAVPVFVELKGTTTEATDVDVIGSKPLLPNENDDIFGPAPTRPPVSKGDQPKIRVNVNLKRDSSSSSPTLTPVTPVFPFDPKCNNHFDGAGDASSDDVVRSPRASVSSLPTTPRALARRDRDHVVDRSDTESICTVDSNESRSSDKENKVVATAAESGDPAVVYRKKERDQNDRVLKEKKENAQIHIRPKTLKRTRKFVIDGVVVTTTTSKVIYGDENDKVKDDHILRKQELRELKMLQKQEVKQYQGLIDKANFSRDQQEKRFDQERGTLERTYENDVETLNRQQKQQVEKAECQQDMDLKIASKKIRSEQEKDLKKFREDLKQEMKLLKQEVDLYPKEKRKDMLRIRKEKLEVEQSEREREFLEKLNESHELAIKRLSDNHREKIALLERQFLQQKQQTLRTRESSLWELEERHLHEKHQLAKRQLKDIFFLQRHQMLTRHEKELEQVKRMNAQKEDDVIKRHATEKRQLPKHIRNEMKVREQMFRESLRISIANLSDNPEREKEKLRKFQEQEKKRYKAEQQRQELKHKRQLEELRASADSTVKELEQLQNEKRKMLMEHETLKLRQQDQEYSSELQEWKTRLKPRKQKLEEEFARQVDEQERFYGAFGSSCHNYLRDMTPSPDRDLPGTPTSIHSDVSGSLHMLRQQI